jgi:hypothetical protein
MKGNVGQRRCRKGPGDGRCLVCAVVGALPLLHTKAVPAEDAAAIQPLALILKPRRTTTCCTARSSFGQVGASAHKSAADKNPTKDRFLSVVLSDCRQKFARKATKELPLTLSPLGLQHSRISAIQLFSVIPAKAGIHLFNNLADEVDPGFRWGDEIRQENQRSAPDRRNREGGPLIPLARFLLDIRPSFNGGSATMTTPP